MLTRVIRRNFGTTRTVQAFTKKSTDNANLSVFKRGTPSKSKGWISNFKDTSAYSRLGKEAPKAKDVDFFALDNLKTNEIMRFPTATNSSLAAFGSFKRGQRHELFKDKTSLIRENVTLPIADFIAKGTDSKSSQNRMCLLGESGTGKSTALSQAQALAILNGYIVLPITRPRELISGDNDAFYNEKLDQFIQPMYSRQWLKRVLKGNKTALQSIEYKGKAATVNNLYDYIKSHKNSGDKDIQEVVANVMNKLEQCGKPVLFTLDDLNIFTEFSHAVNVDVENKPIYHGKLQFPKLFLDYLSGAKSFSKGAIIASTTGANRLNETIPAGLGLEQPPAYSKIDRYDPELAKCLHGVTPFTVPRYSQNETKKSIEYWHSVNVFPNEPDQSFIDQKYAVSGNGNPRSLLEACTRLY